jgi:uncharacterized protein YdeI (YjbR/CyaY-like superfamily)
MKISKTYYAANRKEWRAWLKKNFKKEKEIWLVYYKKHTGKPRVAYNDAVEEALCFGWIDSNLQKINDEKYAQKFTPRNPDSKWSKLNITRMKKLIVEKKMTKAGLIKIDPKLLNDKKQTNSKPRKKDLVIPEKISNALKVNKLAWKNFNNLASSYKRLYVLWIMNAKREETFNKRVDEAITLLEQNKKLGMK